MVLRLLLHDLVVEIPDSVVVGHGVPVVVRFYVFIFFRICPSKWVGGGSPVIRFDVSCWYFLMRFMLVFGATFLCLGEADGPIITTGSE
jgi:hypothetical protein